MNKKDESLTVRLRAVLSKAGFDMTSQQLQDNIREFNLYEMPLTSRKADILYAPGKFIEFLKNKKKVVKEV